MSAQIFDGRAFAEQKEKKLILQVDAIAQTTQRKPKLVAVGIGQASDVNLYLSMKEKAAQRIGIDFEKMIFREDSEESEVLNYVGEKNRDSKVDGIILELPIPDGHMVSKIMEKISPQKDVDCMTYENLGKLLYGQPRFLPATVRAIMEILFEYVKSQKSKIEKPFSYKHAVVIGGGIEVGKPLALWLSDLGAAVSLCRSTTRYLSEFTKNADIIISAVGVPNLVKGGMVKDDAVVVDAGINLVNGKVAGDVEFSNVSKKASFITPVPGGVGPLTIVSLFENLVDAGRL